MTPTSLAVGGSLRWPLMLTLSSAEPQGHREHRSRWQRNDSDGTARNGIVISIVSLLLQPPSPRAPCPSQAHQPRPAQRPGGEDRRLWGSGLSSAPATEYCLVDTQERFETHLAEIAVQPRLATDIGFHRERTYFPKVALIPVGWSSGVALVDPLNVDETG